MRIAVAALPVEGFVSPGGFTTVTIDTRCGKLAGPGTPEEFRSAAQFISGTEPKGTCKRKSAKVEVPDVFSFPVDDAIDILEDAGFEVNVQEEASETYDKGRVIGQDPAGGSKAPKGSIVTIVVSSGGSGKGKGGGGKDDDEKLKKVPSVIGLTEAEAKARLADAGFSIEVIRRREPSPGEARKNRGKVWKQSPSGGSEAKEGSTVTIWVNP